MLQNNLAPFFQTQLALTLNEISLTQNLLKVCRKLEARKTVVAAFNHPPSRKSCMLEPDLLYVETTTGPSSIPSVEVSEVLTQ